jgi:hypothetical protein
MQALQRSERQLARHNSRFLPIASEGAEAIEVHYTVARPVPSQPFAGLLTPSSKPEAAPQVHLHVHCVHGLGANTYSWSFVQDMLAAQLGAVTTAHDIPGFGLTQRCGRRLGWRWVGAIVVMLVVACGGFGCATGPFFTGHSSLAILHWPLFTGHSLLAISPSVAYVLWGRRPHRL